MMTRWHVGRLAALTLCWLSGAAIAVPRSVQAHCDGMDGPVVTAARQALAAGNVDLVLVWVDAKDEPEIRHAFTHAQAVRNLGPEAANLADTYFFETLVRVHRAGEGAAYSGLKPAGRDLGPAIPLADKALATGAVDPLLGLLTDEMQRGVRTRFAQAREAKQHAAAGDVAAGRDAVHAYVTFIHYVERLQQAATQPAVGHVGEGPHVAATHDE